MTPARAEKIRNIAKREALSMNFSMQDAEEFSQDVVVYFLLRPNKKSLVRHMVLDAVRKRWGDPRNSIRSKKTRPDTLIHLSEKIAVPIAAKQQRFGVCDVEQVAHITNLKLPSRDRAMLILYLVYGFNLREIGVLFGLSEARISYIFKGML